MRLIGAVRALGLLVAFAICACSQPAHAFGAKGHRLIGELAQPQLKPAAAAEVARLLKGETLAQVASWADELREERRDTAPWHFMNFSAADCRYQPALDCPKGNCLVPTVQKHIELLRNKQQSPAVRAEALRFVVHQIGDLHQPLHLGYARDKGGNDFQIAFDTRPSASPQINADDRQSKARQRWWRKRTQGYNLHSLWDTQLLESAAISEKSYLQILQQLPSTPPAQRRLNVVQIAQQSCNIVRRADFYPPRNRINRHYVELQRPVVNAQLRLAGDRLAELLNQSLAP